MTDISQYPDRPVMIVESPEAAAAAQQIVGTAYIVTTPPEQHEFGAFFSRKVLVWPDVSQVSRRSMKQLAEALAPHCQELKILIVDGEPGWNAAAALQQGWDFRRLVDWARPRAVIFNFIEVRNTTIINNEAPTVPDVIPESAQSVWDQCGLAMTGQGQPILNLDNVNRLLNRWEPFKGLLWFDEFHHRYFTRWRSPGNKTREWKEIDDLRFTQMLQEDFGMSRLSDDIARKALMIYAHANKRNEPKDWMDGLRWDNKPRIDRFFIDYIGAKESAYIYAISRNFWIGMVARIYRPGCQLDNMVILEGKQGIFKSSALRAIGGAWYMEAHEQVTSKDFFQAIDGRLVVEISELDSFSRAEGTRVKQVITCSVDRYRASYGHRAEDHPRRCIFVGSTNEEHYLKEAGRRFWPVRCGQILPELITKDRAQLFAEAVARFKQGEDWYHVPAEMTATEQEARRQMDEWESMAAGYLIGRQEITLGELAAHFGVDRSKLDITIQRRLGGILRRMGWLSQSIRRDGFIQRVWVSSPEQAQASATRATGQLPFGASEGSSPDSASTVPSASAVRSGS